MRGKEAAAMGKACAEGITPAYAGKSAFPEFVENAVRDHPRVCGEKMTLTSI